MKRFISIMLVLLMMLAIVPVGASAASEVTISTKTDVASVKPNESFVYTVSLAGTYDGYSLKINKKQSGLTVTDVSVKSGINADDFGDCWMISVIGGLCKVSADEEEVATVSVTVDANASAGVKKLGFSEIIITNEIGDAATYSQQIAAVTVESENSGNTSDPLEEENDTSKPTDEKTEEEFDEEPEKETEGGSQNTGNTPGASVGGVITSKPAEKETEEVIDEEPPKEITEEILPAPIAVSFRDVKTSDWFYENVQYVVENKLMNGVAEGEFAPNKTLTRAMLVTVLYRNAGEPAISGDVSFEDVDGNAYFAKAVLWAKQNGIVNGVTSSTFAPNTNITREQIAAIMYRYAQYRNYDVSVGEDTNILSYDDAEKVSEYAISSMQYVVGSGLIKGKTASTLNPKDNATRAEIATILQRFIESNK